MKSKILLLSLLLSGLAAALNNFFNINKIPWVGSPRLLDKPKGEPAPGFFEGLGMGFGVSWDYLIHWRWPIVIVLLLLIILCVLLKRTSQINWKEPVFDLIRIGLGIMFLMAAWPKFANPNSFAFLVAQYRFLPDFLVNAFSLYLPALEIVVGIGILISPWTKEFAFFLQVLMVMFIIALTQALWRELGIVCGCFDVEGAQSRGESFFALIRDVVLSPLIIWLFISGRERFLFQWKK